MKEATIEELAYVIRNAEKNNHEKPIFFLGAGASASGNIPLAKKIVTDIKELYPDNPRIKKLKNKETENYAILMGCLLPSERDELMKKYINEGKINVTHIYLARLLKMRLVDYVLTVNFDNLMLRASSLFNEFPPAHDLAILNDFTTTAFKKGSVVYLHGRHHGLWLLNTEEEMEKVKTTVPRIFDSIKNGRPWIFIGYSANDPIFNHIKNLGRFDNGLYWVAYHDNDPSKNVKSFLEKPNTNAFIIRGYDSDSFMLKLNSELSIEEPTIIDRPFSSLKGMLDNIVDIDDDEHFKPVKQRLTISHKQVAEAIQQFEEGKVTETTEELKKSSEIDLLKKEIIDLIIKDGFNEKEIGEIELKVQKLNTPEINSLLSDLYTDWAYDLAEAAESAENKEADALFAQVFEKYDKAYKLNSENDRNLYNWGTDLAYLAKVKDNDEGLFKQAFEKYQKATEIKPDKHEAFNNWGNDLADLAKAKNNDEDLFKQAFEKYQKATEIKPDKHSAFYNWGIDLVYLAKAKNNDEDLFKQAFEKYQKATEIKPDMHEAFYNWGNHLAKLAIAKNNDEDLFKQAFEKYQKTTEIKPDMHEAFFNWGNALANLAIAKNNDEDLFKQAFEKYQKATEIKPDKYEAFNNWGTELANLAIAKNYDEDLFKQAFKKYLKATEIKPDYHKAFNNWGADLANLATAKNNDENLFKQAFEKYKKATEIKPDYHEAFNNWGNALSNLAIEKNNDEQLYKQAFEKYQKATEIKPDMHEVFYNWGSDLTRLAQTKEEAQAEELYSEAIEKFEKSIELGGDVYNLACLYAVRSDKENALKYLDLSLSKKEVTTDFVLDDDDWKDYLEDDDFKALIEKYKTE